MRDDLCRSDLASAVDMLDLMSKSGHEPTVDTYGALAMAQAEQGDVDGVKWVLGEFRPLSTGSY